MMKVARFRGSRVVALTLLLSGAAGAAAAQGLSGRPGVDYYPPWMLDSDQRIPGGGQDYRIWDDRRFDRRDEEFIEFQRQQRRELGPGYRDRPEYRDELQRFEEDRADRAVSGSARPAPLPAEPPPGR